MRAPHLHALGRDTPHRLLGVEIKLAPLRGAQFPRAHEKQRGEFERIFGARLALIAGDRAQQLADPLRLGDAWKMFRDYWRQCARKIRRDATLEPTGSDRELLDSTV